MFLFGIPLSLENLFVFSPLGLSIAPPLAVLGIFYLVVLHNKLFIQKISFSLLVFFGYALLASTLLILVSFATSSVPISLANGFFKQLLSLIMGIISFFTIRSFLVIYGYRVFFWIALGGTPSIVLSTFHIFGYFIGSEGLISLMDRIRLLVLGRHITTGFEPEMYRVGARVAGFTGEPAHFGAYLSLILIPSIVITLNNCQMGGKTTSFLKLLFILSTICLLFTFSGTTVLILLAMTTVYFSMRENFSVRKISIFLGFVFTFSLLLILIPSNYIAHHFFAFQDGNLSWIGKFGGSIGPIYMISETANFWGYGLGASNTYIEKLLPEKFIEWQSVWAKDSDYIKTLIGKIGADLGVIGLALFLNIFLISYLLSRRLDSSVRFLLPAVLVGVLVAAFNGNIGSLSHPFVWLWPAFIEALYRMKQKEKFSDSSPRAV